MRCCLVLLDPLGKSIPNEIQANIMLEERFEAGEHE
jgi:hypothetical protein